MVTNHFLIIEERCRFCQGDEIPCIDACPQDAILPDYEKNTYYIDQCKCFNCGLCRSVCKFGAIVDCMRGEDWWP